MAKKECFINRKVVVISGVNLVDGGPLSVYHDFLSAIVKANYHKKYRIIALVGRKELFEQFSGNIELLEFSKSKKSWLYRIYYEYFSFKKLSKLLNTYIWVSMHDITPNILAEKQYVYCHNPSPFNRMNIRDARFGMKYYLFSKFYKYLYAINIKKNNAVIVQQEWMRKKFMDMYNLKGVIVAKPSMHCDFIEPIAIERGHTVFIMPSYPRYYKNFEIGCKAARILNKKGRTDFKLVITLDGTENKYSSYIKDTYGDCLCIDFCGLLDREKLFSLYSKSHCLIFMSKLETWGMPITEFKVLKRPMIVADLPYAHETVGSYRGVDFVEPDDEFKLADSMLEVIKTGTLKNKAECKKIEEPFAENWDQLCELLFE